MQSTEMVRILDESMRPMFLRGAGVGNCPMAQKLRRLVNTTPWPIGKSKDMRTLFWTLSTLLASAAVANTAWAADAAPEAPAAAASASAFDFSGHIDIGYPGLSGKGKFANGINNRVFDFEHKDLILHAVDLQVSKLPEYGFGGLLNVTLGKDADTIAAYGTIDRTKGPANGVDKRVDVTQAFGHYGAGPFSIIAGKYVTLAGAEVIKSDVDVNYSRSILFGYAIPFTHTGIRAAYKVDDKLTLIGGVNNGWDNFKDTNGNKTLELGLSYSPTDAISLGIQGYSGKEQICNYPEACIDGLKGTRNLVDIVATYKVDDKLSFILNFDYGSQANATLLDGGIGKATWNGWAGYAQYQFSDQWRLVLRGEFFDDKDGYRTGFGQKWRETTLTLAYLPIKSIEVRAEVRADKSSQFVFLKSDGVTRSNGQNSFGLEFLYKF